MSYEEKIKVVLSSGREFFWVMRVDYIACAPAITLDACCVMDSCDSHVMGLVYEKYHHDTGWTISGKVIEDYFTWVRDFKAKHPVYGDVSGDFEEVVYADNEEGFMNFVENHPPKYWDYGDI